MNKLLAKYTETIQQRSNKTMLKTYDHQEITYAKFDKNVNSLANILLAKFNDQQIIPVISNYNLDYVMAMIACWKINKTYLPINFNTPAKKVENTL
ncbi:MAG: AMP-binding protein [Lactobacillus sp.]|nr:AMP-binding protein [Lactobacillus sp.]